MKGFYRFVLVFILPSQVLCNDSDHGNQHADLFKQLFKQRRAEQRAAIKHLLPMQENKQFQMVMTVSKTIFDVILKSTIVLEESGYTPGLSEFPEKEAVRDALSLVLENTALMGDIVLRLPDVASRVLNSTPTWLPLFTKSLSFVNQTQLLDNSTTTMLSLVHQELNLTERSPDYKNPYRKVHKDKTKVLNKEPKTKKPKKKSEIKRGPRLTLPQTGEL